MVKGKKHSEETKQKIRLAHLGKKYKPMSEQGKENIRKAHLGLKQSEETKAKLRKIVTGRRLSEKTKRILSEQRRGAKNYNWKGGVTPIHKQIRKSVDFKLWRATVFARDNYACVWCGVRGHKGLGKRVVLHPDHIKPFALFPELRFVIDNGRTLCIDCHKKTDTWGKNIKNYA